MVNELLGVREKKGGYRKVHSEVREKVVEASKIEVGNGCVGEKRREETMGLPGSTEGLN